MLAAECCSGQQDSWTGLSVKGCPSSSGLSGFINFVKMFPESFPFIFISIYFETEKMRNVVILS